MPRVRPRNSWLPRADLSQMPSCIRWVFSTSRRVSAMISPSTSSTTLRVLEKGALKTATPRSAASMRSTWLVPMQKHPIARRSFPASSTSAVILVLERIPSRDTPGRASASSSAESDPGRSSTSRPARRNASAAVGWMLSSSRTFTRRAYCRRGPSGPPPVADRGLSPAQRHYDRDHPRFRRDIVTTPGPGGPPVLALAVGAGAEALAASTGPHRAVDRLRVLGDADDAGAVLDVELPRLTTEWRGGGGGGRGGGGGGAAGRARPPAAPPHNGSAAGGAGRRPCPDCGVALVVTDHDSRTHGAVLGAPRVP